MIEEHLLILSSEMLKYLVKSCHSMDLHRSQAVRTELLSRTEVCRSKDQAHVQVLRVPLSLIVEGRTGQIPTAMLQIRPTKASALPRNARVWQ